MIKNQPNDKALYVIRKSPYGDGGQLVLHVTDTFKEGYICFDDTNRGHMIKGEITEQDESAFTMIDKNGDAWIFEIVTIEMFREDIYQCAYNGKNIAKLCTTTNDLGEYFRKEFPI